MDTEFLSRREKILQVLRQFKSGITAEDIARYLVISNVKIVYEDLSRLAKTIRAKNPNEQLGMTPPLCRACGFLFTVKKPKKPSKCPQCKSERIDSPSFSILNNSDL